MRIAIDTAPLVSGHTNRGVGGYTKNLIEALKTHQPEHTYLLFDSTHQRPPETDIIHYPFFDPFFLTLPLRSPKPTVVTVHDLIPIVFPEHFPRGLRGSIKWEIQKYSLQRKQRIITDSECSKKDIMKCVGIADEAIDVVCLAPSPVYQPVTNQSTLTDLRKKYQLSEKFIMYVGDVNWNKNIVGLLRACARLVTKELSSSQPALVLVGKAFLNDSLLETKEIDHVIDELKLEKKVVKVGYVPDEDLAGLYTTATCLVQPSFYEGFGLPVLEAFACGCPVVAADNSSLSEIIGPAIRVSADHPEDIAKGIHSILSMFSKEKDILKGKGIDWVKQFTWKKTAHETVRVYERSLK